MMKKFLPAALPLALFFSGCDRREDVQAQISAPVSASAVLGEKAYRSTCSICHKTGLNGAPRTGNKEEWERRAAQGNEMLYVRAIKGYQGSRGFMPPRGSNLKLSDDEVKAAVDYMIGHSRTGATGH